MNYLIFIDYSSTINLKKYFEIINCQLNKKLNLLSQQKLILSRVNSNNNTKNYNYIKINLKISQRVFFALNK